MTGTRRVELVAPAKVNLSLRVLGRRADGYHEVETLLQAVDFGDDVTLELGGSDVALEVDGPDLGPHEDNLAVRAAVAYRTATGLADGVRITLCKRVPAGAGLGGGSSDAAAVLSGLAALTADREAARLLELAAGLGSDVPFFLGGSPLALARGRGERLTTLEPLPEADLVLVLPPVHVGTAEAYRALAAPPLAAPGVERPFRTPGGWDDVAARAYNEFEAGVAARHPEVARSLEALSGAGARLALLTGSGAACFGLFESRARATEAADAIGRGLGWPARAVRTLARMPRPVV